MKKITKAVIPAAGLGTRMLPIAHAVPKEMLPIVDRPALDYLVAEAAESGITDILIITGRGKGAIEDYFDYSPEYEWKLAASGKEAMLEATREPARRANIYFLRQKETKGLGHAILCAEAFVAGEPFAVLYGDDVIDTPKPFIGELENVWQKYGIGAAGVQELSDEFVMKYCSLDADKRDDGTYYVRDMIEKPSKEQIKTNLSILGRVILPPEIFDILRETPPGAGNELQLTDAMATLARTRGMSALYIDGKRFDMGNKLSALIANITIGVKHPETGEPLRSWLKEFVKTL